MSSCGAPYGAYGQQPNGSLAGTQQGTLPGGQVAYADPSPYPQGNMQPGGYAGHGAYAQGYSQPPTAPSPAFAQSQGYAQLQQQAYTQPQAYMQPQAYTQPQAYAQQAYTQPQLPASYGSGYTAGNSQFAGSAYSGSAYAGGFGPPQMNGATPGAQYGIGTYGQQQQQPPSAQAPYPGYSNPQAYGYPQQTVMPVGYGAGAYPYPYGQTAEYDAYGNPTGLAAYGAQGAPMGGPTAFAAQGGGPVPGQDGNMRPYGTGKKTKSICCPSLRM